MILCYISYLGSGKTVCAEFAMLKSLKYHPEGRIVYLSSNQAVCNEKYIDWKKKFGSLGVSVVLLTGDNDLALLKEGIYAFIFDFNFKEKLLLLLLNIGMLCLADGKREKISIL